MSRVKWIEYQIYQPRIQTPSDFPKGVDGLLYFPAADVDIAEVQGVIEFIEPYIVVPPVGDTFEQGTMHAHIMRNDPAYHCGLIVPGMHADLIKHIKWAVARGFEPVIMRPNNFYGGVGTQDKTLWQMQQHGTWIPGAWYHLATGRPHELQLPGRWTVSADFVGAHGARK